MKRIMDFKDLIRSCQVLLKFNAETEALEQIVAVLETLREAEKRSRRKRSVPGISKEFAAQMEMFTSKKRIEMRLTDKGLPIREMFATLAWAVILSFAGTAYLQDIAERIKLLANSPDDRWNYMLKCQQTRGYKETTFGLSILKAYGVVDNDGHGLWWLRPPYALVFEEDFQPMHQNNNEKKTP